MTATSTLVRPTGPTTATSGGDPKRFRALAVIAVAQLMVVLDASVVIIALPSAQRALHISTANRQWMLTAYTLAFAGLLLLGGRIADYFGRKRMFVVSLVGFAGASALGGLAQNAAMLFSARALQGAFAAVMAPAALSLLTVAFTEPKERARAFGVYGAIAGGGQTPASANCSSSRSSTATSDAPSRSGRVRRTSAKAAAAAAARTTALKVKALVYP